jgi:hypothetical protein
MQNILAKFNVHWKVTKKKHEDKELALTFTPAESRSLS